jgi:EAL domain-containing protein (putative c-di-GMP-specific phosphodiesterase class I)
VAAADADSLLRDADIALYVAKAEGRGTWRTFRPEMNQQMQARRRLETELRRALAEQQFEVFYQPLLDVGTGNLAGFEALLRWQHPDRGSVPPADFIPLAEETSLIKPIGAWVLEKACCEAAKWPLPLKIAINLSPVQFVKGRLMEEVRHALDVSGLVATRLELEITESVLLQNSEETLQVLKQLRELGVQISMDDFGTGYSSLSYLRSFPFDKIKIDRAFVQTLADGKGSLEIIRAVVGLGRALNMKVLAEGVETAEQLAALRAEGCDEVQGYLFSRPVPVNEAWRKIAEDQRRRSA